MPIMLGGRSFIVPAAAMALWAVNGPGVQAQALTKPQHWELFQTKPPKVLADFPSVELCMGAAIRAQPQLTAGAIGCKTELPAGGKPHDP
jgi:hypothetical protein